MLYIAIFGITLLLLLLLFVPCHVEQKSIGNALVDTARSGQWTSHGYRRDQRLSRFYSDTAKAMRKNGVAKSGWIDHVKRQSMRLLGITSTLPHDMLFIRPEDVQWWAENGVKIREAIRQTLPIRSVEYDTAVHLRFGDVPFGELNKKQSSYHMQYYAFYDWAFKRLKSSNILLVYSTRWRSNLAQQEASEQYVQLWINHFRQHGYNISTQSDADPLTDFATLFHAQKMVGSAGSFAFMAGVGRSDETVCMPMLGLETPSGIYQIIEQKPVWMSPIAPLLHSTIRKSGLSYLQDVEQISKLLELTLKT